MPNVFERYLSLSPREKRIVRTACAASDVAKALSLLSLYFPQITLADVRMPKGYTASH